MKLDECVKILTKHNEWLKSNENFDMNHPELVGKAIDVAIVNLRCMRSAEELLECCSQTNQTLIKKLGKIDKILKTP